jgi:hypothetical protein
MSQALGELDFGGRTLTLMRAYRCAWRSCSSTAFALFHPDAKEGTR